MRDVLVLLGWIVGALLTGRAVFVWLLEGDRDEAFPGVLLLCMILWPFVVGVAVISGVAAGLVWLVTKPPTRRERREVRDRRRDAELEQLRAQAKEFGLPLLVYEEEDVR